MIMYIKNSIFNYILIHLHIKFTATLSPAVRDSLPLWSWECINEKCVPFRVNDYNSKLQSLETCNMLCAAIPIWPQPTGLVSLSTTAVPICTKLIHLQITLAPSKFVKEHISDAFDLMRTDLKSIERKIHSIQKWRSLIVRVSLNGSADPQMRLSTDESYKLALNPNTAKSNSLIVDVTAKSFCGVRHAFETLSQLIWLDPYLGTLLILEEAKIEDAPKFNYRGLLIDTAHSYYPINELFRTIDAMGACKLNTLHWHASDSHAFSLRLLSIPQTAVYGSMGSTASYSVNDILAIIRRARLRGIRVIIEIDTPAHVGRTWSEVSNCSHLTYCLNELWSTYCFEPTCGQLSPLERIYAEIIQLTGVDDIFHLGGAAIAERGWEEQFNNTNPVTHWTDFTKSALSRLEYANGKLPNLTLMWSSRLNKNIKTQLKDYVHSLGLQSRKVAWAHKQINGLRTVISHEDAWDLNSGMGEWHEETGGAPYNSWQRIYEYRPWSRNANWRVVGGEATVWSSLVSSGGLDSRTWPRAAALSERLWTDKPEGPTRSVHARLDVFRTRLLERGIKAAPIWSLWCTHNTHTCI